MLRYIVLSFATLLLGIALLGGRSVWSFLYQTGIVADDYRFGDLYRLSGLPQFKEPQPPCPPVPADTSAPENRQPGTALYLIGDSFTEPQRLSAADWPGATYRRLHWDERATIQFDTAKRNVLVIETVERHLRDHLSRPVGAGKDAVVPNYVVVSDTGRRAEAPRLSVGQRLRALVHLENIEERLEVLLFSQPLFDAFREAKASLNWQWFRRVSPSVAISKDGQHLFAAFDADTTRQDRKSRVPRAGSFTRLSDADVTAVVDSLNAVYVRYRNAGFDDVVLSVIPSKMSVLAPTDGPYNHLIERVQQHPALKMPFVDVFGTYRRAGGPLYALSDSHWNCQGRALWVQAVRKQLRGEPDA